MDEQLAGLWPSVAHVADRRMQVLERAVGALARGDADAEQRCADAVEHGEMLVGSLGSYGRADGSALARDAVRLLADPGRDPGALGDVVRALRAVVERPAG